MLVVVIAELPCMIRTAALQLQNGSIWNVIWGTVAGSAVALLLGLGIAKTFGSHVGEHYVNWIAGALLVGIGLYMMFSGDHNHQH